MHVAYIHQHFATKSGSTGTRSYELSQRLLQAGHKVTMICGAGALGGLETSTQQRVVEHSVDGIRVLTVTEPYSNRMSFTRRILAFGRFAREAERIIKQLDADLVFASSTPLTVGLPGMKGARHLGVPFVFEVRDLWPEIVFALGLIRNPLLRWYLRRLERRIYKAASWIIALSPGMKEGIERTGYPADRITMIPNSSDLDLFVPAEEKRIVDERFGPPEDIKFVFTGAHGLANGLDGVLDAIAELKRRGFKGVRFVFIGDGSLKDEHVARSRREGLDSYVVWADPIPKAELAKALPHFDVGMMVLRNVPGFYFGTSPNKFFDYIASGLPVLNNYPGWLAGMIKENNCGLAVPPDDPSAFADAVVEFCEKGRTELREMGKRSRALAEREFSRSILGRQFVSVLEQVLAESRK